MWKDRYIGQFRPGFSRLHEDSDLYWIVPFSPSLMLGLMGERYAGVSTVAGYLEKRHGFQVYSLWDEPRRSAEERGVSVVARHDLQELGDELRYERRDAGTLARFTLRRVRRDRVAAGASGAHRDVAVTGIKHVEELRILAGLNSFHLAHVTLPDDTDGAVRYRRVDESGMLGREYSAERERSSHDYAAVSRPEWKELDEEGRKAFLAELDTRFREGHSDGRFPADYLAVPGRVIAEAQDILVAAHKAHVREGPNRTSEAPYRLHELPNSGGVDDLHGQIDKLLDRLRPPDRVVRH